MASRSWQGAATPGGSNDWFVADNWTTAPPDPNNFPQPGDQVSIGFGEPTIQASDPQPLANEQVTLGSTTFDVPAEIISNGATFDANFTIDGTAAAPYAAIALNQSSAFDGTIAASADSFAISNNAPLGGSGTVSIEKGATVTFNDAVPTTQTVSFLDPNGTLLLNDVGEFGAKIVGFQSGDRIQVNQIVSSFTYAGGALTLIGQNGPIGTLDLTPQGTMPELLRIYVTQHNSVILSSQAARSWAGGSGDWYDPANWTNGVPLGGDSAAIGSGTASISAADAATYGVLDFETITLGTPAVAASATLETDGVNFGPEMLITTAGQEQNSPTLARPQAVLLADGTTLFNGNIQSVAQGGRLTIDAGGNGGSGNFVIEGDPSQSAFATVSVSQESSVAFTGGTITNDGLVQVTGDAMIAAGTSLQGNGTVELLSGGRVAIEGAVGTGQQVAFLDKTGILTLSDPAAFGGQIDFAESGDRVDLTTVQAQSLSFGHGTLDLLSGGNVVASLGIYDPNDMGAADFTLAPDRSGQGSQLTYTPQVPATLDISLPVAAVGTAGELIPLTDLLVEAFGTVPPEYPQYMLSLPLGDLPSTAYWDQQPGQELHSAWAVNGGTIDHSMVVNAGNIGSIELRVGNNLYRTPSFTVPIATGAAGNPTEYVQYNIWTVAPAANAPQTADSQADPGVPGSAARFGRIDAGDEVASALRYSLVYPGVLNSDNCNWIADNVAAGAGATMPYDDASTDPTQNLPGGFWRTVYRGSDSPNPVADWFTLVQPGDVVRLGRQDQFGHHTTTVIGTVNPDGTLTVYDNGDHNSAGQNIIDIHDATYWVGNDPSTITIYRLDPLHQYLIQGTSQSELLQGSVFNNLIQPGGGADTITAGAGSNEIQDTTAHLNGITVTDFHLGDTLDFTDLTPADASGSLDATGLAVMQSGKLVASVSLPGIAAGQSIFASPDGSGGTIFTLAPVSLDGYGATAQAMVIQQLAPLAAAGRTTSIVASADGTNMPAPIAGQYNVALITDPGAGSTVVLPSGYVASSDTHKYQAAIAQGSNPVSLVGPGDGHALLVGNQGDDVIAGFGPLNTLLAGSGNDLLLGGSEDSLLIGGSGSDTLLGGSGSSTLVGGSGGALMGGSGAAIFGGTGQDTVVAGGGSDTVSANGDMLVFGGAGTLMFLNGGGSSTVVGATGSGSVSINGGLGGGMFGGGTGGGNLILAGQQASTVFGGGSGDVLFAAGSASDALVAGSGNETLSGLGSSGDNVFFVGPGADLIGGGGGNAVFYGGPGQATVVGTGGRDLYAYAKGVFAGGATTIMGFDPAKGDRIALQGYAAGEVQNDLARANVSAGSTALTLSDGTALEFVGVVNLTSADFV